MIVCSTLCDLSSLFHRGTSDCEGAGGAVELLSASGEKTTADTARFSSQSKKKKYTKNNSRHWFPAHERHAGGINAEQDAFNHLVRDKEQENLHLIKEATKDSL